MSDFRKCHRPQGRLILLFASLLACTAFFTLLSQHHAQAQNPEEAQPAAVTHYAPADIAYGARIFKAQCTACHGANGDAISGLNFRAGIFPGVSSDNDLRRIITSGVAGTAMPAWTFNSSELEALIAYLRSMASFEAGSIRLGDAAHGKVLFDGAGDCMSCHRVNGKGPRLAPDLSDIGALRTPDYLERTLLTPDEAMLPVNRSMRLVTRDGKVITGRRLNEDTYSIQLIDAQQRLVSFDKSGLRSYEALKTSGMPSYKDKFSSEDIADLVAYLLTLRGSISKGSQ